MDRAMRPRGGASALWEDIQALAVLTATHGAPLHRTRTQSTLPEPRRGALPCQ